MAEVGNDVLCLDLDAKKIRILEDGGIPIHEPGLLEMVKRNIAAGRLRFTTSVEQAVQHGTIQFSITGPAKQLSEPGRFSFDYLAGRLRRNVAR